MFKISDYSLGKYNGLSIYNEKTKLNLLSKGLTFIDLYITLNNHHINILDGYKNETEFETYTGARNCFMVPYSNRIKNFSYKLHNIIYSFTQPDYTDTLKMHGLIKFKDFNLIDYNLCSDKAELKFETILYNDEFPFYPFNLKVVITLKLSNNFLKITISGINENNFEIPFGCGWHPYFKLGSKIDNLILAVPSKTIVLIDETFCPVQNYKKLLNPDDELYFLANKVIGNRKINVCYTDLIINNDNQIHTYLIDKAYKIKLDVFQEKGVIYIFTADGLKFRERESIAIEPVEFITDVYNHQEYFNELMIKPNSFKNFNFGVCWSFYE